MIQFASEVFRLQFDGHGTVTATVATTHCDRAMLLLQLDRLLIERQVDPHFQPIVSMCDDCLFGYEILGRSRLFGLEMPTKIFEVAAMFDLEPDVSELFRSVGLSLGSRLAGLPNLFVNTHPSELGTPQLLESMTRLRDLHPDVPLTLEIHEAAVTSPAEIGALRGKLRDLNVGLAYDDFGAGQSRLLELIEIPPDFIKFDMGFIRNIDTAPDSRRHLLQSLVNMVRSLGIASLAEGVETASEAAVCRELGFDFAQGFHFGRPQAAEHYDSASRSAGRDDLGGELMTTSVPSKWAPQSNGVLAAILASDTFVPQAPTSIAETGLSATYLEGSICKQVAVSGAASGSQVARQLGLSLRILQPLFDTLRTRQVLVHAGSTPLGDYVYRLTDQGRAVTHSIQQACAYVGPAPVPLADYVISCDAQSIRGESPRRGDLERAFSTISASAALIDALGPAINSGAGLFLHGARATANRPWPSA